MTATTTHKPGPRLDHPQELGTTARSSSVVLLLRALRPHQWLKNLLLFVPFLAAHAWSSTADWVKLLLFFIAFSFAASGAYLLNDIIDLDSDRRHPEKRRRPMASGALPKSWGLIACPVCLAISFTLTFRLGAPAAALIALYLVLSSGYSLWWKRLFVADVLILAVLYTLRIVGGAVVVAVPLSPWLLTLALFLFLSLATAKRYSELLNQNRDGRDVNVSRGYRPDDLPQLNVLGATSGYLSVLVLALYINSEHISTLYRRPMVIWALCPLLLYWISRLWLLTHRGEMHEDPVVFALKDRVSYAVAGLTALVAALAGPR